MPNMSETVLNQKRSGIREIVDLSHDIEGVYHMEIGEPLFNTPDHIIEEGCKALKTGFTKYTPNSGFGLLTQAIAGRLNNDYNLSLKPENVVVTVGGVQAIASAIRVLTEVGDEVLIPDPGWPNYETIVITSRAVPVKYTLKKENGYFPAVEDLEKLITPKTKVLIINSPSNPTGAVIPEGVMRSIIEFASANDIFVISDEVYEKIIFDGEHTSALSYDKDGRVIAIYTFSKTYAMTGWRIGYAVSTEKIISQMVKMQEAFISCAPAVSQKAASAAITGPQDCIEYMMAAYRENREIASSILDEYGIEYYKPDGAFYMWVNANCENSSQFARDLLMDKKVAVAPGSAFGTSGRQYVRISLASPKNTISQGVKILAEYINKK